MHWDKYAAVSWKPPRFSVDRPSYLQDLRAKSGVQKFAFEFEDVTLVDNPMVSATGSKPLFVRNGDMSGTCTFNNLTYEKGQPLVEMKLNVVQEWTVSGVQAHPLHIHINPMQIQSLSLDGSRTESKKFIELNHQIHCFFLPAVGTGTLCLYF